MIDCDVYLYDANTLAAATSTNLTIYMTDQSHTTLQTATCARIGPSEYGAKLSAPNAHQPFQIYVYDPSSPPSYAPSSLGLLNGKIHGRLDVTLFPIPPGKSPSIASPTGPVTSTQLRDYVDDHVTSRFWTPEQGNGVLSLVQTTRRAIESYWDRDQMLRQIVNRWIDKCASLGIHNI